MTVANIVRLALGERIIARIQASLSRAVARAKRRDIDTLDFWP
jgi:hypothetical protein